MTALVGAVVLTGSAAASERADVERAVSTLQALAGGDLQVRRSPGGEVSFLAARPGKAIPAPGNPLDTPADRAAAFVHRHGAVFGLGKESGVEVIREVVDAQGMTHVRVQQTHRDVPVTGAEMTVHMLGVGVAAVLAKALPDLDELEVVPAVLAKTAEQTALGQGADAPRVPVQAAAPPRLEILNRGLLEGTLGPSRLAWFVEVVGEGVRDFVWVDAQRGVVLLRFSQLAEVRSRKVYTALNGPGLPGVLVRSEGQPPRGDVDADAAYDGAGDAYDYFMNEHGRDSFDGLGSAIVSTVQFCPTGAPCPYPNAAWTGTQMVYGEGFSRADDVDSHELTHAVIEHTANLFYYRQPGALNESIADMFGETIDLSNGRGNDDPSVRWQLGEDVPSLGAIRHLMQPGLFQDPGRTDDPLFVCTAADNGGVHTNSGVPNHAYALMVDGGAAGGVSVSGIGLGKAARVVYRALAYYLPSASNFIDFSMAAKQACADLVGAGGLSAGDCAQVAAAMDAVGMEKRVCGVPQQEPRLCLTDDYVPVTLFRDDFENIYSGVWSTGLSDGLNHWTAGAGTPDIYFTGYATSGKWALWGYGYPYRADSWVAMTRDVPMGPDAILMFRNAYWFDFSHNIPLVEYSTDSGASWQVLDSTIIPRFPDAARPGVPGKTLLAETGGYQYVQYPLPIAEGEKARFRFRLRTDGFANDLGWFIDDVRIYGCAYPPAIKVSDLVRVVEGDSGIAPAILTATLTPNPYSLPVSADYTTRIGPPAPGSSQATPGEDFVPVAGRLSFPPGVTTRYISVPVIGDRVPETTEVVELEFSNLKFVSVDPARVLIDDDDVQEGFTISDAQAIEPNSGTSEATFEVGLLGLSGPWTSASVAFATHDGSATAPVDYASTTGTLSFDPTHTRRTLTVPVKASPSSLSPRTFHVDLSSSSGPAIVRARGTASVFERGLHVVTPCRLFDSRRPEDGPPLAGGATRTVVVGGKCDLPATARAVALNLTTVGPTGTGYLTVFPSGAVAPLASTLNFSPGQTRANNAVVALGADGWLSVRAGLVGEVDLIVDVTGFFE